jgi:hypothetical protein
MDLAFLRTIDGHHFACVIGIDSFVTFLIRSNFAQVFSLVNLNHALQEIYFTWKMGQSLFY